MGNLNHDTGTVASLVARLSTAVLHVFQYLQCIVNKFMALASMDVHYHTHAARVVLVVRLV